MAKHEPALEGSYKTSPESARQYSMKITFADYDTGKIEGSMQGRPFVEAGYSRESAPSTKSSLTIKVTEADDAVLSRNPGVTATLNLTADDHSYNILYGTVTEYRAEPVNIVFSKWR